MGRNDREPLGLKRAIVETVVCAVLIAAFVKGGAEIIIKLNEAACKLKQRSNFRDFGIRTVDVNEITATSARVTWKTIGAKRVGIDLFVKKPEMTLGWPDWEVTDSGNDVMNFIDLDPDTEYHFEIVAYKSDGPDKDERKNKSTVHGVFRTRKE